MYLKNILCRHCGYSFTGNHKAFVGTGSLLGVQYMRCQNCSKLYDSGKLAWSQMNFFGKAMDIGVALFKTFFTGLILSFLFGIVPALLFRPSHEWMQSNQATAVYTFLVLGMSASILRTVWYYWHMVPEVERVTREKKWDEWVI